MALKVYLVSLDLVRLVRPLVAVVVREDPDLARQLRRALSSIPLNIAEGESALGRNQRVRLVTALGSAREARACLEVAEAMGYVRETQIAAAMDSFDHVAAMLFRLTHRGR
jgi:four helix bundle protein